MDFESFNSIIGKYFTKLNKFMNDSKNLKTKKINIIKYESI